MHFKMFKEIFLFPGFSLLVRLLNFSSNTDSVTVITLCFAFYYLHMIEAKTEDLEDKLGAQSSTGGDCRAEDVQCLNFG